MVLKEGLLLAGLGVAGGVVVSLGAPRVLSSVLFGVTPTDGVTYTAVALRNEQRARATSELLVLEGHRTPVIGRSSGCGL